MPKQGLYAVDIPLERIIRMITPSSWWYNLVPLTMDMKNILLENAKHKVHVDCIHRHNHYCLIEVWRKGIDVTQRSVKLYLLVHLIPFLLFKKGKDKYSKDNLKKLAIGFLRSLAFICTFASVGELFLCVFPRRLDHFSPNWCSFASGVTASSVFLETKSRWAEFAMTVFPRLIESIKLNLSKQKLWVDIPMGLNIMFAVAISILSELYYSDKQSIKRQILPLLNLIFGEYDQTKNSKLTINDV